MTTHDPRELAARKAHLRAASLATRRAMTPQAQRRAATCARAHLDALWPTLPWERSPPSGPVIAAYMAARGELSVTAWIVAALERGLRVALPRVQGPGLMAFVEVALRPGAQGALHTSGAPGDLVQRRHRDGAPWDELDPVQVSERLALLGPGAYGLLEPAGAPLDEALLGVALIPGVAFDWRGARLGHGGGFYDRWLDARQRAGLTTWRVGVAHQAQILSDGLPVEPHDHRVQWLVTDAGAWPVAA